MSFDDDGFHMPATNKETKTKKVQTFSNVNDHCRLNIMNFHLVFQWNHVSSYFEPISGFIYAHMWN